MEIKAQHPENMRRRRSHADHPRVKVSKREKQKQRRSTQNKQQSKEEAQNNRKTTKGEQTSIAHREHKHISPLSGARLVTIFQVQKIRS